MTTSRIRKPIDELTPNDIRTHPIWRFVSDEGDEVLGKDEDETWVTPWDSAAVPVGVGSLSVAATFTACNGRKFPGIVEVSTQDGIGFGHAALLVDDKYLFLPSALFADADAEYEAIAASLRLSRKEVFPLHFELSVPVGAAEGRESGTFAG